MSHGGEMDWFRVTLHLAGATGERFQLMEALVDTGASYTWIPRDVLEGLGVRPDEERVFVLADGRAVRYRIAWVRVRLDERTQPTLVVCGDSGTEPLLGAFTLEGFGLGVDPESPTDPGPRTPQSRCLRVPSLSVPLQIPDLIKIHIPAAEHSHNL